MRGASLQVAAANGLENLDVQNVCRTGVPLKRTADTPDPRLPGLGRRQLGEGSVQATAQAPKRKRVVRVGPDCGGHGVPFDLVAPVQEQVREYQPYVAAHGPPDRTARVAEVHRAEQPNFEHATPLRSGWES
jgi:hypothetical protein